MRNKCLAAQRPCYTGGLHDPGLRHGCCCEDVQADCVYNLCVLLARVIVTVTSKEVLSLMLAGAEEL